MTDRVILGTSILVVRDNMVIMGIRKGSHGAGTWSFPGGAVDTTDASIAKAAARELEEETGIKFFHEFFNLLNVANPFTSEHGDTWATVYYMIAALPTTEPKLMEPDKCEGWEWVPMNNLPSPLFETIDRAEIQRYMR